MFEAPDGQRIRFWIDPPYPDETTSSVLDRAAAYCATSVENLIVPILQCHPVFGRMPDWDYPLSEHARIIASTLGLAEGSSPGVKLWKAETFLSPKARIAYCPLCFFNDLAEGRTPHFRWQWAISFLTFCHVHHSPLFPWRHVRRYQRVLPRSWTSKPTSDTAADCSWLACDAKAASDALRELEVADSPLEQVLQFQQNALNLRVGPSKDWENRKFFNYFRFFQIMADAMTWKDQRFEPRASIERPTTCGADLFGIAPVGDWKRLPRNAYRGFNRQRSVAWRRSIIAYLCKRSNAA